MFLVRDGRHVRYFDRANCDCGDTLHRRRGRKWCSVHDRNPKCETAFPTPVAEVGFHLRMEPDAQRPRKVPTTFRLDPVAEQSCDGVLVCAGEKVVAAPLSVAARSGDDDPAERLGKMSLSKPRSSDNNRRTILPIFPRCPRMPMR